MKARTRTLAQRLLAFQALLVLGVVLFLAVRWQALAPRTWGTAIDGLAFAEDGRHLVVTDSASAALRLLDLENPLDRWLGSRVSVAFSPGDSERVVAVGSPEQVLLARGPIPGRTDPGAGPRSLRVVAFDSPAAVELGRFVVLGASFGADRLLARSEGGGLDGFLEVRRLSRPQELVCRIPVEGVLAGVLAADGASVVAFGRRSVTVHEASTGTVRGAVAVTPPEIDWAASEGERHVLVGVGPWTALRCVLPGGAREGTIDLTAERTDEFFLPEVPPAGQRVVSWRNRDVTGPAVVVRDTATGEVLGVWPARRPVALAPDGRRLAFLGPEGRLRVVAVR